MGPTAAGKTALAVELVRNLDCEIISVDSALVYRGMDIGTAKPEPEVLAEAPHRLIDIRDPANAYSVAEFRRDALAEMEAIQALGRVPLLVGGTGLYFRALQQGLSPLPPGDPVVRARLEKELNDLGLDDDIQSGCRFISDNDVRVQSQCHCDHGSLTHPTAQFMGIIFYSVRVYFHLV